VLRIFGHKTEEGTEIRKEEVNEELHHFQAYSSPNTTTVTKFRKVRLP
jgi:hypothetical protein